MSIVPVTKSYIV